MNIDDTWKQHLDNATDRLLTPYKTRIAELERENAALKQEVVNNGILTFFQEGGQELLAEKDTRIAELEMRLYSLVCMDCGKKQSHPLGIKSQNCVTCGKSMSHILDKPNPTYRELRARITELEAVLHQVEWVPIADECPWNECPWCHHTDYDGHASDCKRQNVLGETR